MKKYKHGRSRKHLKEVVIAPAKESFSRVVKQGTRTEIIAKRAKQVKLTGFEGAMTRPTVEELLIRIEKLERGICMLPHYICQLPHYPQQPSFPLPQGPWITNGTNNGNITPC